MQIEFLDFFISLNGVKLNIDSKFIDPVVNEMFHIAQIILKIFQRQTQGNTEFRDNNWNSSVRYGIQPVPVYSANFHSDQVC